MRIVTNKNDGEIRRLSYEVLASGQTSGVWSDEDSMPPAKPTSFEKQKESPFSH